MLSNVRKLNTQKLKISSFITGVLFKKPRNNLDKSQQKHVSVD